MCTSPEVISSSPAIIRNRVDFPHPEGPTNTVKDPSSTIRLMPWITSTDWKLLWTLFSSSLAIRVHSHDKPITSLQRVIPAEQDQVTIPLGGLAFHSGYAPKARKSQSRHDQFAPLHCQRHRRSFHFDHSPTSPG